MSTSYFIGEHIMLTLRSEDHLSNICIGTLIGSANALDILGGKRAQGTGLVVFGQHLITLFPCSNIRVKCCHVFVEADDVQFVVNY